MYVTSDCGQYRFQYIVTVQVKVCSDCGQYRCKYTVTLNSTGAMCTNTVTVGSTGVRCKHTVIQFYVCGNCAQFTDSSETETQC